MEEDNFVVDIASTRGPRSINTQSSSRYEKFSAEVSRGRTSDHHSPHQSTTVLTTDKITAGVVRYPRKALKVYF